MKRLLTALFTTILVFTLFYLLGSFSNKSFDLNNWADSTLGLVGGIGGITAILVGICVFIEFDKLD